MILNDIHRGIKKRRRSRRVGRGSGSGHGKTCGRGHKGQGSRAGASAHPTFQGGTMPLFRRIPKRGFNNRWAKVVAIVNVSDLEDSFSAGEEVTPESLRSKHLAGGRFELLKVLGNGELKTKLTVCAHRFSKSAAEKITKAGGEVVVLPGQNPVKRNKQRPKKQRPKKQRTDSRDIQEQGLGTQLPENTDADTQ